MEIQRLYLKSFRNYSEEIVEFSPRANFICGQNAQGKTNLLEALYLLSTGRSFRTNHLKELIYSERPFFFLEAEFQKEGFLHRLGISFDGEVKKLHYNHTVYSQFTPLLGIIPMILMVPEDIRLVLGNPGERRRFLDIHLAQIDPLYVYHLTRYHKAVKQRNSLLKQKTVETLEVWETLMVTSAGYIQKKRKDMVCSIQNSLSHYMSSLTQNKDQVKLFYEPSFTENYFLHRAKELNWGTTLIGPHRDDIRIEVNGKSARSFASQGQIRSIITALKLSEWDHLKAQQGLNPIFCIDDVGVHLDQIRQDLLLEYLPSFGQVFLTSPIFKEKISPILMVNNGSFVKA